MTQRTEPKKKKKAKRDELSEADLNQVSGGAAGATSSITDRGASSSSFATTSEELQQFKKTARRP